jgi:hypothetical protein
MINGTGLLTRQVSDDTVTFVEPRFIKHYNNQPAQNLREEPLSTVVYSQGQYFIYHANDLNMKELVMNPPHT